MPHDACTPPQPFWRQFAFPAPSNPRFCRSSYHFPFWSPLFSTACALFCTYEGVGGRGPDFRFSNFAFRFSRVLISFRSNTYEQTPSFFGVRPLSSARNSVKSNTCRNHVCKFFSSNIYKKTGGGGPPPPPTHSDHSSRCYNQGVPSPASSTHRELVASPEDTGTRLDRFIAANCPELSRTRVQELIEAGFVLINGTAASKGSQHLHGGERITLDAPERPPLRAEPESIPLDILYEDDDLIAVNKAAGMTVHAGAGNHTGTLVNALLGRGQALARSGDALRPGIVHRLDKETSGVILVAKNDFAHAKLSDAFRHRTVKKTYLALVQGLLKDDHGRIELPIGRDPIHRTRMAVQRKNWHGAAITNLREARTDWRVLARIDSTTLVEVQLHTGRTHQIRVHFAALKHPVVGDILYGAASELRMGKTTLSPLRRNFLHAAKLAFAQPRTGEHLELRAPLPKELHDFLQSLSAAAGDNPRPIDAALAGYL
jgi:23S rRNA pseudouridine1911/1915/1917 synthase